MAPDVVGAPGASRHATIAAPIGRKVQRPSQSASTPRQTKIAGPISAASQIFASVPAAVGAFPCGMSSASDEISSDMKKTGTPKSAPTKNGARDAPSGRSRSRCPPSRI